MSSKMPSRRAAAQRIYQLRVELDEIQPAIWRRLWVPDTLTLAKLDRLIQAAMGWTNSHLHEFEIAGRRYGIPDDQWVGDESVLDERRHIVGVVLPEGLNEFVYTYDFGDDWRHSVTVEKVMPPNEINAQPVCVAGQNACPPEDVGGLPGYMEFLAAMRDPVHEEHIAMWQWYGGPFDPSGFDLNATNAAIRKLRL